MLLTGCRLLLRNDAYYWFQVSFAHHLLLLVWFWVQSFSVAMSKPWGIWFQQIFLVLAQSFDEFLNVPWACHMLDLVPLSL